MEPNTLRKQWVQGQMVRVDDLGGVAFTGEANAHTFLISGIDQDGSEVPISGTITGKVLNAAHTQVPLSGSVSDGVASITMSQDCYAVPGRFVLSVFATTGDATACIYCGVGTINNTGSGAVVYPTTGLPDLVQLVAQVQEVIGSIPADYSALVSRVDDLKSVFDKVTGSSTQNLLEETQFAEASGISVTDGEYTGKIVVFYNLGAWNVPLEAGKRYTVSMSVKTTATATSNGLKVNADYSDGTTEALFNVPRNISSYTQFSGTTAEGKNVLGLRFSYANGANDTVTIKEMQVEEGTTATEYTAYERTAVDEVARQANTEADIALGYAASLDRNSYVTPIPANADLDNYTTPGNYKVTSSATATTIANIPVSGIGRLLVMNLASAEMVVQYYIVNTRWIHYRVKISGAWSAWMFFNTCIKPKPGNADNASTIRAILLFAGRAELVAGDYYISNLNMPAGSTLQGAGLGTRLHFIGTETGAAITLGDKACVKDLTLMGADEPITITGTIGNRNGILWTETETDPHQYGTIEHCHISGFDGAGIVAYDTGTPVHHNLIVSDCVVENCNVGVYFQRNTEFNKITNCTIVWNYYGVLSRGGNNIVSNCGLDRNTVGIQIDADEGTNGGHGSITGCTINHSDNNTGYGLIIRGTGRMLVSNCNFYYSKVLLGNPTNGNIINGCGFGNNGVIEVDAGSSSNYNMIANNMFRSVTGALIVRSGGVKLSNNWSREGNELVPTTAT